MVRITWRLLFLQLTLMCPALILRIIAMNQLNTKFKLTQIITEAFGVSICMCMCGSVHFHMWHKHLCLCSCQRKARGIPLYRSLPHSRNLQLSCQAASRQSHSTDLQANMCGRDLAAGIQTRVLVLGQQAFSLNRLPDLSMEFSFPFCYLLVGLECKCCRLQGHPVTASKAGHSHHTAS